MTASRMYVLMIRTLISLLSNYRINFYTLVYHNSMDFIEILIILPIFDIHGYLQSWSKVVGTVFCNLIT